MISPRGVIVRIGSHLNKIGKLISHLKAFYLVRLCHQLFDWLSLLTSFVPLPLVNRGRYKDSHVIDQNKLLSTNQDLTSNFFYSAEFIFRLLHVQPSTSKYFRPTAATMVPMIPPTKAEAI